MPATDSAFHHQAGEPAAHRRQALMAELHRVDRSCQQAAADHQAERMASLEHYRDRIAESLAALAP